MIIFISKKVTLQSSSFHTIKHKPNFIPPACDRRDFWLRIDTLEKCNEEFCKEETFKLMKQLEDV